jgi:hypothetical protein
MLRYKFKIVWAQLIEELKEYLVILAMSKKL